MQRRPGKRQPQELLAAGSRSDLRLFKVGSWRADIGPVMLNRRELDDDLPAAVMELRARLEAAQLALTLARAENLRSRNIIQRHLEKGCPSKSLQALLEGRDMPSGQSSPLRPADSQRTRA